jgi:hypothetical protein
MPAGKTRPRKTKQSVTGDAYGKREIAAAIAFGVVIFLLLWLRRPDSLLNAQFWAEDGGVFFREQVLSGFAKSFVRPYSGYLHAVPRLIAAMMAGLPVRWVPLGYNLATLFIEALACSAFAWPCFRQIINSDVMRAACCVVMTTAIVPGSELLGTLSNVQWYLSIFSLLLLVAGGQLYTKRAVESTFTVAQVLIALTAPATLLFFPLLLWQLNIKRGWLKLRPALHLAALCTQILVFKRVAAPQPKPLLQFNALFLATLTSGISRCILRPLFGYTYLDKPSEVSLFTNLTVVLILCVAIGTLFVFKLRKSPSLLWLAGAVYFGAGSLAMVMAGRRYAAPFVTIEGIEHFTAERYFLIGACMFIFSMALFIDTFTYQFKPLIGAALLLLLFSFGITQNFAVPPFLNLNWKNNAQRIAEWEEARHRGEKVATLSIPINPENWSFSLDGN